MLGESMQEKIKGAFMPTNKRHLSGGGNGNVEEWEVRPGGMLVQKRSSEESTQISLPVSMIKVRVKYGSIHHEIRISSQASFGDLKKLLAECTGVHPQDQKLMYKKRERDSKAYLDVSRVKDGSKIVLIEDIRSRERRCIETLKSAKLEKASKLLQEISLEVDKLGEKLNALEASTEVSELDVDNLTEILMSKLVILDNIIVSEGNLKLQKRMQERRVQKHIETLDMLKLNKTMASSNGGKTPLQKDNPTGQMPARKQMDPGRSKNNVIVEKPIQQQPLRHKKSVVVTTEWETFD